MQQSQIIKSILTYKETDQEHKEWRGPSGAICGAVLAMADPGCTLPNLAEALDFIMDAKKRPLTYVKDTIEASAYWLGLKQSFAASVVTEMTHTPAMRTCMQKLLGNPTLDELADALTKLPLWRKHLRVGATNEMEARLVV